MATWSDELLCRLPENLPSGTYEKEQVRDFSGIDLQKFIV
jgi:hypothetical protein